MTSKLCAIILDGLGPYNIRQLNMEYIQSLYRSDNYSSDLLCTSGLAHTPISNPMIWGQYKNDDHIWVENHPYRWTGGIDGFDPIFQEFDQERAELYKREDMETNFIWDVLDYHGLQTSALGIPVCLPPYCYNAEDRLDNAWFPHTPEMLQEHIRKKPEIISQHIDRNDDFICTSIKVPDQWLHAQGSGIVNEDFIREEVPILEDKIKTVINKLESNGYDWLIFGDHGSPVKGRTANHKCKKLLARHRKEAIIIGSTDIVPRYTEEMFPFFLDYFDVENIDRLALTTEPAPENRVIKLREQEKLEQSVIKLLESIIDENCILLWTGGKEANVLSDILINKIGTKGKSPIPFGIVDTGNHFDEIYDFRENYLSKYNINYITEQYDEMLNEIINNQDDPRGYHGRWNDDKKINDCPLNLPTDSDSWDISSSCGVLKTEGIKRIIDNHDYDILITGQRSTDPLFDKSNTLKKEINLADPAPHTRIHPLIEWKQENVYSYIQYHDVSLPSLYYNGYIHTDSICCTSDNQISEYGKHGREEDKLEVTERLQEMGYL